MKYRKLGNTGLELGEIGMGLEHLLDKDAPTVADTIKAAAGGGVNYFDCHPGDEYLKCGNNDVYDGFLKFGEAVKGIRDKIHISYIAHSEARTPEKARPRFENYLKALKIDYADVFVIQFCDKITDYEQVTGGGLLDYAYKLKDEKKIGHIGISTHSAELAFKAIGSGFFDVLMYPVNPAFDVIRTDDIGTLWDAAYNFKPGGENGAQPRKDIYSECELNGIGLVAMKPFAGGFIFGVEKDAGFTPVNLVSYALAQNGVSTVIPGCADPRQIEQILAYYTCDDAARDYSEAVFRSRWSVTGNCVYCNHCLPCVSNINIGQVNRMLDAVAYKMDSGADGVYDKYNSLPVKASACVQCGVCEERCPFRVKVIDRMKKTVEIFEKTGE